MPKNWKGGPFEVFQHPFSRKTWKNWRKQKFLFSEKNLTVPKKNWKGGPLGFSNIHSVAKQHKNWNGDPLGEKISGKKISQCRKKIGRWDPLVSPGMVWYAGKQEKPFWFSSLDQIVQFGAIIFCRTFKNYFGQFVWIEKKVTIIVAFHFMKRRLKSGTKEHQNDRKYVSKFGPLSSKSAFSRCFWTFQLIFWRTLMSLVRRSQSYLYNLEIVIEIDQNYFLFSLRLFWLTLRSHVFPALCQKTTFLVENCISGNAGNDFSYLLMLKNWRKLTFMNGRLVTKSK